jgi:hypothetical protein
MNATLTTAATTLLTKAEALIASGGLHATNRQGVYRALSSDGVTTYLCGADFCFCAAGERGSACCHVLAAQVAVADAVRAQAAARGIRVLRGQSQAELLGEDRELDLYGPAE